MFDRFKEFIGIDDNYDDYDDDQMYYDDEDDNKEEKRKRTTYSELLDDSKDSTYTNDSLNTNKTSFSDDYSFGNSFKSDNSENNVVSINSNSNFTRSSNMRISIQEPLDYDNDGPVVIEEILKNRVVVLNSAPKTHANLLISWIPLVIRAALALSP